MSSFSDFIGEGMLMDSAVRDYQGLQPSSDIFLTYYDISSSGEILKRDFTKDDFWHLTMQTASVLISLGMKRGDRLVHFFSGNKVEDLLLRAASVLIGTVPVTVNWQADTVDKVLFKISSTEAKIVFVDKKTSPVDIEVSRHTYALRPLNHWRQLILVHPGDS
jgi:long-subunit acyl-CoA synthetase (AMP-forming)